MIQKIYGPAHEYAGPSLGFSTENGDNWKTAVRKMNENFEELLEASKKASGGDAQAMQSLSDGLKELQDLVLRLASHVETLTARVTSLEKAIQQPDPAPSSPPPQPPSQPPAEGSAS